MRPDFDELVGTDLPPGERERLERVHELLVAAGPPPDLTTTKVVELRPRRRRGSVLAVAAALAVAAFALGAALVDGSSGRNVDFELSMEGVGAYSGASATLTVFDIDEAGNWPMELEARDLQPLERPYELWLTRDGELIALCGSFRTSADGSAVVPLNAPYRFDDFDGWVVVEAGSTGAILVA